MTEPEEPEANAVGCGVLLLIVGLLLVAGLAVQGILLLRVEEPRMGHMGHVGATLVVGPFALILVAGGMRMIRRKRWD